MRISEAKVLMTEIVTYNLDQAKAGKDHNTFIVPFFVGDPGLGKTAVPKQVARELDLLYKDVIIAQYDAGELAGLPMARMIEYEGPDGRPIQEERMVRLRPTYLPNPNIDEECFCIFNLDELPQAFLANQNIASQLVNEYRVGEHEIPAAVTMCATGNKPENKAGTTTMPTHLRDRLMFVTIEYNADDFLNYAAANGLDPRIRAFLRQNPDKGHMFTPGANANPSPRSWEKTSNILKLKLPGNVRTEAIHGQIGEGAGTMFEGWLRVEDRMPKLEDILADPEGAPVFGNKDADVLYLLLASLADIATEKNVGTILKYIKRLPNAEFQAVWVYDATMRDKALRETKPIVDWKIEVGAKILS